VTVKLSSSGGAHTSYALKSHVFCVPHNGPKVTSRLIAVNMGVAKTFTLLFIGEKSVRDTAPGLRGHRAARYDEPGPSIMEK
jgi:hypothetical protein